MAKSSFSNMVLLNLEFILYSFCFAAASVEVKTGVAFHLV